jgi:two-component system response regulator AlgR
VTSVLPRSQAPLTVLLVDDEALARLRLRSLLENCQDTPVVVVGEASDAVQAKSFLAHYSVDLVLLDIAMPGLDGTQLAASLKQVERAPWVVFVTAHAGHAVQAFELDAVDYLTKPVRLDRLQAALLKVLQRRAAQNRDLNEPHLVVSDRGRVQRIPVSQALYFKAEMKYVTLRTLDRSHLLDESLSELEQRLGSRFIRIHRNALVARNAVRGLERRLMPAESDDAPAECWAVHVAWVDEWLVVSRRHVASLREALGSSGL